MRRRIGLCAILVVLGVLLCACGKEEKEKKPKEEEMPSGSYECTYYAYTEEDKTKRQELGSREYIVDEQGRLAWVSTSGALAIMGDSCDISFTYDSLGRITKVEYKRISEDGKRNGVVSVSYYEDTMIATERTETVDGILVSSEKNRIEFGGVIVEQTCLDTEGNEYVSLAFDPVKRTVTEYDSSDHQKIVRIDYYDESGRLIRRVGDADSNYAFEADSTTVYRYDKEGVLREEECRSASGAIVGRTYYDENGREKEHEFFPADRDGSSKTVTEYKEDPALPGETVKVITTTGLYSDTGEKVSTVCYRRVEVTDPYYLFQAAYGSRLQWELSVENSKYYYYEVYRYKFENPESSGSYLDMEFTSDGRPFRETYQRGDGETAITEFDEHGNKVREFTKYKDGTVTVDAEWEYTYY